MGMDADRWAQNVDPSVPSSARMYDFYLGGTHNFEADREAARRVIAAMPEAPAIARVNRGFLGRAVRFLLDAGVRQFLDVGSGVPTVGNVHEIAQRIDPDARVVYVDIDPVAVIHARQLLAGNDRATAIVADLRRPEDLLGLLHEPSQRAVLDLSRPVGLLLVSMLHFVPGEEAYQAVTALRDALAPGSYLVLTHGATEGFDPGEAAQVQGVYQQTTTPGRLRSRPGVKRFFGDFDLVPPGLVWVREWHPAGPDYGQANKVGMLAGVARKPPPAPMPLE
jgi:O-methyltransferase involved in polyketide biosynthesis